jgi:hypothetical protein
MIIDFKLFLFCNNLFFSVLLFIRFLPFFAADSNISFFATNFFKVFSFYFECSTASMDLIFSIYFENQSKLLFNRKMTKRMVKYMNCIVDKNVFYLWFNLKFSRFFFWKITFGSVGHCSQGREKTMLRNMFFFILYDNESYFSASGFVACTLFSLFLLFLLKIEKFITSDFQQKR